MQNQEQVEAHLSAGKAVFICELTADCDSLIAKGCVATVANGEWPDIFQGHKVVAVGGEKFAATVPGMLESAGAQVVLMTSMDIATAEDKATLGALIARAFEVRAQKAAATQSPVTLHQSPGLAVRPDSTNAVSPSSVAGILDEGNPGDKAASSAAPEVLPPAPDEPGEPPPYEYQMDDEGDEVLAPVARAYGSLASRWADMGLSCANNGMPHANASNALHILEKDPSLLGQVWYDTFLQSIQTDSSQPRAWDDSDDIRLMIYMQRDLAIHRMSVEVVRQAVSHAAIKDQRNCLQDNLRAVPKWDETPRCDMFFTDCFGAEDNIYTRAVGGNFWKSLVARALRPGCKVDNMVILEGAQGIQKSTACKAMVGSDFFTEAHEDVMGKDFYIAMQGKWMVEINEMDAFSRAETTKIKSVISCQTDRFRPPYGRRAVDHPRQSIFIGTTNKDDYNKDETGFRRAWPILCGDIRVDLIRANRDQLLAEAMHRLKAKESWWEMPGKETQAEQEARYSEDPWTDAIAAHLFGLHETTAAALLYHALRIEPGRQTKVDLQRAVSVLRTLGWRKSNRARRGNRIVNIWRPGDWFPEVEEQKLI